MVKSDDPLAVISASSIFPNPVCLVQFPASFFASFPASFFYRLLQVRAGGLSAPGKPADPLFG
jgi:hypothetical protein